MAYSGFKVIRNIHPESLAVSNSANTLCAMAPGIVIKADTATEAAKKGLGSSGRCLVSDYKSGAVHGMENKPGKYSTSPTQAASAGDAQEYASR